MSVTIVITRWTVRPPWGTTEATTTTVVLSDY